MTKTLPIEVRRNGYCLARVVTYNKLQPLVCIADSHLGHRNFNEAKFKEVIKWINDRDALWFGGGDLIENSNKNSVGAGWVEQVLGPQVQIDRITDLLFPISKRCLGLINGNHEDRSFRDSGLNPTQIIAGNLQVPYCGDELFWIIANDKKSEGKGRAYTGYACHTKAASKSPGLAFNKMMNDMGIWLNVDIVAKAHGHDMGLSPPAIRVDVDKRNMAIVYNEMYYWLVGHYLDRPNSYISKSSKPPKPLGTVAALLDMDLSRGKRVTSERI